MQGLCKELGLEYLYSEKILLNLKSFFLTGEPSYIYDLLPLMKSSPRYVNSINAASYRSEYFKNSLIPNVINKWNKLNPDSRSSTSYNLFRKTL